MDGWLHDQGKNPSEIISRSPAPDREKEDVSLRGLAQGNVPISQVGEG